MRTNIAAGKLIRRAQLQRLKATVVPDASGHIDYSVDSNFEFVQNRWVAIIPSSSKQFLLGDQLRADVTHQITMRYDTISSNITVGWRLQYQGVTYGLVGAAVDRNLDHVVMDFPAMEVSAG